MCVVSMVADHYREKWYHQPNTVAAPIFTINPVTREEFDALRRDVDEMKALVRRAQAYDERNGEPECEMAEKVDLLRKVAALVGVELDDVFGTAKVENGGS